MRMRLILVGLLAYADSQSNDVCFICGVGNVVTVPDAVIALPGQPSVQCDVLSIAGLNGLIPNDECALLPVLVTAFCGCAPEATAAPVSKSPTTNAPHYGKGKGKANSPGEKVPTPAPIKTVTKKPTTEQNNGKGKGK